ncbi:MAG: hypothetical protein JO111_04060 [Caulobacteraceae bacterium]|nr:hypothetical protein [Caulobacteraceae bacterium]
MTLNLESICPTVDPITLLQFRSDALQTWTEAPLNQREFWLKDFRFLGELLEKSAAGPVELGLR